MIRPALDLLANAARHRLHHAAEAAATAAVLAALPPLATALAGMTWLGADRDERIAAVRRARQGAKNRILARQARRKAGMWREVCRLHGVEYAPRGER